MGAENVYGWSTFWVVHIRAPPPMCAFFGIFVFFAYTFSYSVYAKCIRLFEHLRVTHVMAARDVKGATRVELTQGSVIGQIL